MNRFLIIGKISDNIFKIDESYYNQVNKIFKKDYITKYDYELFIHVNFDTTYASVVFPIIYRTSETKGKKTIEELKINFKDDSVAKKMKTIKNANAKLLIKDVIKNKEIDIDVMQNKIPENYDELNLIIRELNRNMDIIENEYKNGVNYKKGEFEYYKDVINKNLKKYNTIKNSETNIQRVLDLFKNINQFYEKIINAIENSKQDTISTDLDAEIKTLQTSMQEKLLISCIENDMYEEAILIVNNIIKEENNDSVIS